MMYYLPGVATTTWTPFLSASIWGPLADPPMAVQILIPAEEYFPASSAICWTSSLVGANISILGVKYFLPFDDISLLASKELNAGKRKASVFPKK